MICEHWTEDENYTGSEEDVYGGDMCAPSEFFLDPKNAWHFNGLKFCCKIEGKTWEEVMTKYHIHMGWEPYVPMSER